MFIFAKFFVRFLPDLAAVLQKSSKQRAQALRLGPESGGRGLNCVTHILVTGGSGFIGQHLVAALLAQGHRVRILDLRPPSWVATEGAQYIKGSVLDAEVVRKALADVDEVYHTPPCRVCGCPARRTFMP
jgi:hypothetical protein